MLKQLRKAKKWSQTELGRRIGLSQERVSAIENHPEKVTLDNLLTILMALDAEFIVRGNPEKRDDTASAPPPTHEGNKPAESW